jgi:hypothetical protein
MVEMHEMVPGKRFDRYHELGQEAFGKRLGLWIVVPQQLLVEVSVDIVYMVAGGQALKNIYTLNCHGCSSKNVGSEKQYESVSLWILIYGSVHLLLVHLPNLNSIAAISLAAAIMSVRSGISLHSMTQLILAPDAAPTQIYRFPRMSRSVAHNRIASFDGLLRLI